MHKQSWYFSLILIFQSCQHPSLSESDKAPHEILGTSKDIFFETYSLCRPSLTFLDALKVRFKQAQTQLDKCSFSQKGGASGKCTPKPFYSLHMSLSKKLRFSVPSAIVPATSTIGTANTKVKFVEKKDSSAKLVHKDSLLMVPFLGLGKTLQREIKEEEWLHQIYYKTLCSKARLVSDKIFEPRPPYWGSNYGRFGAVLYSSLSWHYMPNFFDDAHVSMVGCICTAEEKKCSFTHDGRSASSDPRCIACASTSMSCRESLEKVFTIATPTEVKALSFICNRLCSQINSENLVCARLEAADQCVLSLEKI